MISEKGIQANSAKIEVVQNQQVPKNVNGMRQFLGFTRYYHKFVKGFAE